MWTVKVCIHGGSLSASLPKQLCRDLNINRGDLLLINYSREGQIVSCKLSPQQVEALEMKKPGKVPVIR